MIENILLEAVEEEVVPIAVREVDQGVGRGVGHVTEEEKEVVDTDDLGG